MNEWPEWCEWELELSPHLFKRMRDRNFSEVDLRDMMEQAVAVREDRQPGRWILEARHDKTPWEVIVEPDFEDRLLVVFTAYSVDE